MRTSFVLLFSAAILTACGVDTTGLSKESSRTVKGPSSALVTVTEFADFQCPACGSAYTLINVPLEEKYGNRIRFEFKHFPLRSIHTYAFEAAQASECAADQGKFWEFVDINYNNQKDLSSAALRDWGMTLGLDADLFDRCIRSGIKEDTVMENVTEGEKLGVAGTPSYFVNGQRVQTNNIDAISAAIDAALQQSKNVPL
jgi:protein-disulfide isomerase